MQLHGDAGEVSGAVDPLTLLVVGTPGAVPRSAKVPSGRPSVAKNGDDHTAAMPAARAAWRRSGEYNALACMSSTTTGSRAFSAAPQAPSVGALANDCIAIRHGAGTDGPALKHIVRASRSSTYTDTRGAAGLR